MTSSEIERQPSVQIDQQAILRHLGLRADDVNTQALLLICSRYSLDPLMKHMVLINGKPYVTRDGYLHIAHLSGQLDGIEIIDEGASDGEWWAKVAVHRKDMSHPFTYSGRYPKDGQQKKYGPEMAVKTAEVMALRRAFDVTGVGAADEQWDENVIEVHDDTEERALLSALVDRFVALSDAAQTRILGWMKRESGDKFDRLSDLPASWYGVLGQALAAEEAKTQEGAARPASEPPATSRQESKDWTPPPVHENEEPFDTGAGETTLDEYVEGITTILPGLTAAQRKTLRAWAIAQGYPITADGAVDVAALDVRSANATLDYLMETVAVKANA